MPTGTNAKADRGAIVVFIMQPASSPPLGPTKQPLVQLAGVQETVSLGVKQPQHKVDHSSPSGTKTQHTHSFTFTPLYSSCSWGIDTEAVLP